jgi:hypothetical protein
MKFSVIHPTARVTPVFANPWWLAAESALMACDNPAEVEYILVVHKSRAQDFYGMLVAGSRVTSRLWGKVSYVINYGRDCLVDQSNAGIEAATGEILIGNQDDMRYPEHWDTELLRLIPDTSQPYAVQTHTDGGRKDLLTIPMICTRVLSRAIGTVSAEYESMFSDDEWSIKAWKLGGVIPSRLYFEHLHFTLGKSEKDSVYESENREEAYRIGYEVFERRKALGFPRVPFPDEISDPAPAAIQADFPTLAICIPGDAFSGAWLDAFLAMGMELKEAGYIVKRFRAYHSNVYNTRIALAERVIEDAKISGEPPKYVLWIDHDNVAAPGQLTGLLKFLEAYPHVDAVAGWCWIAKTHGYTTSVGDFWAEDGVHLAAFNLDALFMGETAAEKFAPKEIEHTGFPFFLMRYEALERLGPYAFRPLTKADLPLYFDCPVCHGATRRFEGKGFAGIYWEEIIDQCETCKGMGSAMPEKEVADHWFCGEDTAWCLQAKKAGMTIVVDPGCKVGHLKLQLQEPITARFTDETPVAEMERSTAINGKPVKANDVYEKVMT